MKNSIFKQLQPHLIAIGVFLLVTILYFSPILSGKALQQHDIGQWIGMSKEITDFRNQTGQEALWTNSMFSGMPAYQISVVYSGNLIRFVNTFLWLWLPAPANLLFLSLIGFYLLLISLKADYRLAIAGSFAYALCSYQFVCLQAGHDSKVHALAILPLVVAGVLMAYRGKIWQGGILTAMALALEIYANHLQITYYLSLAIGVLVLCEGINAVLNKTIGDFMKASLVLVVAVVLAVLPNIPSLWGTYEYGQFSTRGASELTAKKASTGLDQDYATDWSYGKMETMTLLIPNFNGGSSSYQLGENSDTYKALVQNAGEDQARSFVKAAPLYWGQQPMTSGPVYNGAIPFYLFVLAMFLLRGRMKWWLIAVSVLSITLAWGKNFHELTDFFFNHFPAYNKFRAVSMMLVLVSFAIPLGAVLAVMKFMEKGVDKEKLKKALLYSFYIVGGICALFVFIPGMFGDFRGLGDEQLKQYDWLLSALVRDRESALRLDALRSLFFVAVGFSLMWFWLKGKLKSSYMLCGLALFILFDMIGVDKRFLNNTNFTSKSNAEKPFEMTAADEQILQDKTYYRVMNTSVSTFNDASTSYFHKSIGGYHGAKLKRYQELIEYQISKGNMNVLNMLNTKYFIGSNPQDRSPMVQINNAALGNAWFVDNWKVVPNADAEMKELDSMDTRNSAVIDQRFADEVKGLETGRDSSALIKLTSYAPNDLKYISNSTKDQLAIFSDIYYPKGWNAYLDGKLVNHIRVNYVLRGMKIPSGKHDIEFKFEPEVYKAGEKYSLIGSVLLIVLFVGMVVKTRKDASSKIDKA